MKYLLLAASLFFSLVGTASADDNDMWALRKYEATHHWDAQLKITVDNNGKLDWDETKRLARRFRRLASNYDTYSYTPTDEELLAWVIEILPYYQYEGIVDEVVTDLDVKYKQYINDGKLHNHLAGQTYCASGRIELNWRYVNTVSSWYNHPHWLWTVVHEITHAEGICLGSSTIVEPTTQAVTAEMLAALANSGHKAVLPALTNGLDGIIMGELHYQALEKGRLSEFYSFRKELGYSATQQARFFKSVRYWNRSNPGELKDLLRKYKHQTFNMLFEDSINYRNRTIYLDDLAYFIRHAEDLVKEY